MTSPINHSNNVAVYQFPVYKNLLANDVSNKQIEAARQFTAQFASTQSASTQSASTQSASTQSTSGQSKTIASTLQSLLGQSTQAIQAIQPTPPVSQQANTPSFTSTTLTTSILSYQTGNAGTRDFVHNVTNDQLETRFNEFFELLQGYCNCHEEDKALEHLDKQIDQIIFGAQGLKELEAFDKKESSLLEQIHNLLAKKGLQADNLLDALNPENRNLLKHIADTLNNLSTQGNNHQIALVLEQKLETVIPRSDQGISSTNDEELQKLFQELESLYDSAPTPRYLSLDEQNQLHQLEQRRNHLSNDHDNQFLGQNLLTKQDQQLLQTLEAKLDSLLEQHLDSNAKQQEYSLINQLNQLQDIPTAQSRALSESEVKQQQNLEDVLTTLYDQSFAQPSGQALNNISAIEADLTSLYNKADQQRQSIIAQFATQRI